MEKSTELRDFILSSYKAMLNGDIGFWERHLSQHKGVLMIGTDPNEWWEGSATILRVLRPQAEALTGSTIEGDLRAYVEGTVGWYADNAEWRLPNGAVISVRFTGVCNKESGDWKIVQSHASIGIPNEEAFGQELET